MSNKRYPDEFKIEAVKQVTERGHAAVDVGTRLGVSQHSLYEWIKRCGVPEAERAEARSQQEENRRLSAELEVIVHSDQGSQFSSHDWQSFLKTHHLIPSMSRRGNCHDNDVAKSFFQLLKRERIRRRIYADREEARQDVFDYTSMFYHPKRRHSYADGLSPVQFEQQYLNRLGSTH